MRVVEVVSLIRSVSAAMWLSSTGGLPGATNGGLWCSPVAKTSRNDHASALIPPTPTARSFMMPIRMPAFLAADWAARNWSSASHCSQT